MEIDQNLEDFLAAKKLRTSKYPENLEWNSISNQWLENALLQKYMYNFTWMDVPIIQLPTDIVLLQELIWKIKPDLIIETGVAHGGSLIFGASILSLIDLEESIIKNQIFNPNEPKRKIVGIEIEMRQHNLQNIRQHSMSSRIEIINGSSTEASVVHQVKSLARNYEKIMIILDSNHTHDHVLAELENYANLVNIGSYCIVLDTYIEDLKEECSRDRPWGPGNNPKTAVMEFLGKNSNFVIDKEIENKLMLTSGPGGCLKRIT